MRNHSVFENLVTHHAKVLSFLACGIALACQTATPTSTAAETSLSTSNTEQSSCPKISGSPIAGSAELEEVKLPRTYEFLEGPTWVADQNTLLFSAWNFTDAIDDKAPPPTTIVGKKGDEWFDFGKKGQFGTNGLAISPDGSKIIAALSDQQELGFIGINDKKRTTLASEFKGKKFNSPNDIVIRSDGTVYFTDPDYQRGNRSGQGKLTGVFHIDTKGKVSLVDGARTRPNGLTLSPDEQWLYVGSAEGKIFRYPVAANGDLGEPIVWAEPGFDVDGVSHDCAGNIYAAIHTERYMLIYDPSGKQIGKVEVPHKITNIAFGDADAKTIYITTAGYLYAIRSQLPGHPY